MGTGLQSGVLFLFPHIVKTCLAAQTCGTVDVENFTDIWFRTPPMLFKCPLPLPDGQEHSPVTFYGLWCKIILTCFLQVSVVPLPIPILVPILILTLTLLLLLPPPLPLLPLLQAAGTAIGEIPPFLMSRTARLAAIEAGVGGGDRLDQPATPQAGVGGGDRLDQPAISLSNSSNGISSSDTPIPSSSSSSSTGGGSSGMMITSPIKITTAPFSSSSSSGGVDGLPTISSFDSLPSELQLVPSSDSLKSDGGGIGGGFGGGGSGGVDNGSNGNSSSSSSSGSNSKIKNTTTTSSSGSRSGSGSGGSNMILKGITTFNTKHIYNGFKTVFSDFSDFSVSVYNRYFNRFKKWMISFLRKYGFYGVLMLGKFLSSVNAISGQNKYTNINLYNNIHIFILITLHSTTLFINSIMAKSCL